MHTKYKGDILLVGVLDKPESTNAHMAEAFSDLGYNVVPYNYRTITRNLASVTAMERDFLSFIKGRRFDLILFSKVDTMSPGCLHKAGKTGATWYWFMDNLQQAKACKADTLAAQCVFASATSNESVAYLHRKNASAMLMLEGYNPHVYYQEQTQEKLYDVVFIGNATPKRIDYIKKISQKYPVVVFGSGWPPDTNSLPSVYNDEYRRIISQSKIILNFVHSDIFSDRVVHTLACGGMMLSEHCPDLEKVFTRGEHLDWFQNPDEALSTIRHYLENPLSRQKLGLQGMAFVTQYFSWEKVCRKILHSVLSFRKQDVSEKTEGATALYIRPEKGGSVVILPIAPQWWERRNDRRQGRLPSFIRAAGRAVKRKLRGYREFWRVSACPFQKRSRALPNEKNQRFYKPGERVLFVSWHGLGDNVMITPALRKLKEDNPDIFIGLTGLSRFGRVLEELLEGLPFIDAIHPVLPDAWTDFASYREGVEAIKEKAGQLVVQFGYDRMVLLPCEGKQELGHKVLRFAGEVGVCMEKKGDLMTELNVSAASKLRARGFLEKYARPWLVLHTKAGNTAKSLPPDITRALLRRFSVYTVFEFGESSVEGCIVLPENDMLLSKAIISEADFVLAIDSVVMHIAGALGKETMAIFTMTPVHQALPLTAPVKLVVGDDPRVALNDWLLYKKRWARLFPE